MRRLKFREVKYPFEDHIRDSPDYLRSHRDMLKSTALEPYTALVWSPALPWTSWINLSRCLSFITCKMGIQSALQYPWCVTGGYGGLSVRVLITLRLWYWRQGFGVVNTSTHLTGVMLWGLNELIYVKQSRECLTSDKPYVLAMIMIINTGTSIQTQICLILQLLFSAAL